MKLKPKFIPFEKWSFVDQHGRDDEHWYVRLEGGEYHNVIYRYMNVKINETQESINFDYEIVDYPGEDPHGVSQFNDALGSILQSILDDTYKKQDYILGPKNK
jgi:hypothetical protein|tara:strand:- start:229 stop:537 length:309 start_codon:yes stop_codon:yes gene_type:complete